MTMAATILKCMVMLTAAEATNSGPMFARCRTISPSCGVPSQAIPCSIASTAASLCRSTSVSSMPELVLVAVAAAVVAPVPKFSAATATTPAPTYHHHHHQTGSWRKLGMSSRRRIPGSGSKYDSSEHRSTGYV